MYDSNSREDVKVNPPWLGWKKPKHGARNLKDGKIFKAPKSRKGHG